MSCRSAVAEAHKNYATEIWSIHFYASLLGKNAYEGLWNLALSEDAVVKCCTGDQKEWNDAIVALRGADTLVLDLTAIATLRLLRLERILWSKPYQFVMSQHTWIEIQETLTDMKPADRSGGVLAYEDGRYTLYEESPESRKAREEDNQDFLNKLQANVRVVPAVEFAAVDSTARDTLEKFVGLYGAESMTMARDMKPLLWTDDSLQGQAAAQIFGSQRVWTQIILVVLVERGLLPAEEYIKAIAHIVGFRYLSTTFSAQVMLEAVRQSKFRPDSSPLETGYRGVLKRAGSRTRPVSHVR